MNWQKGFVKNNLTLKKTFNYEHNRNKKLKKDV